MPRWRQWLSWSAAGGLLAAVVALSEVGFALEEGYGLKTLFRLRGAVPPPPDVVVLRLDNDSLSVLRALPDDVGEWPAPLRGCAERHPALVGELLQVAGIDRLPRRLQACVVELAHAAGAATIVYDVAFPASPDREAGTAELAAAIAAHGRVVLREATRREHLPGRTQLDIVTSLHPRLEAVAAGIATARLPDATGRIDQFWVRDRASPAPVQLAGRALEVSLLDTLETLARRLGRAPAASGPDARRQWLVTTALAADAAGERLTPAERAAVAALRRVHHGAAHLYFGFYGPPGTLRSLPLWQLLDGTSAVPLAGATLFVGKANLTTSREPDTFETVMTTADGVRMSGVELWATAFANLRDDTALRALPEWRRVGVLAALGVLLMLVATRGGVTRSVVLTVAVAAAWVAVAVAAFVLWRLWLPFVGLVVLLPATLLIGELRRFARARRSATRYMPTAVAHRVFDEVDIPTTWLDATVLLTDVVDFAARARRLEAQGRGALRAFQDRHIAMLATIVRSEGGEVLEQTGDGVLALWTGQDHPAAACRAALAIAARIEIDNTVPRDDQPPLRIRIGINSGPVTVGLIGGPERRFLTCSGDTVNMTQRLEALGKHVCPDAPAAAILLGQRTAAALGPGFTVELVAHEVLRGHLEAEPVYRLHLGEAARARRAVAAAAVALALLLPAAVAEAAPDCPVPIARLVARAGSVSVDGVAVDPGSQGIPLCADSVVVVGADSRATLLHLGGDTMFQLDAHSRVRLGAPPEPQSGLVELTRGALFFISQVRRVLTVRTPSADAGIEGTEVLVAVGEGDAPALDLRVYDGRVALRPGAAPPVEPLPAEPLLAGDRLLVAADGGVALLRGDVASLRLAAARELAWTLYYPPLFPDLAAVPAPLAEASRLLAAGRVEEARAVLAAIPDASPLAADRDALLAVIAVSQGDATAALPIAEAAVARQRSAATLLARSYALQALRRLEEARDSARAAGEVEPMNALAWARLAELELAFGDSRAARRAADRSVATGAVPLVHVVQGFARLAAFDARGAEASFATALDADSNQPLAHLGRGLAQIRRNQLEEGRRGLEAAAALDPARSLLRSYLGKAYFEERRAAAAADQLRIAKELDPDDPTPWLYSAIQKQLENRPVEALRDLERSIALNDNRATFRSGLLLDEDRATRSFSLARIYDDLGLVQQGVETAGVAASRAPAAAAPHLSLADLYRSAPRQETARLSESLQADILAPVGTIPLQPSRTLDALNIPLPAVATYFGGSDFTGLFDRDGVSGILSTILGTDETRGVQTSTTVRVANYAASAAQFFYETDGFRPGSDLRHQAQQARLQTVVDEDLTISADFLNRDSDFGDLTQSFDGQFNGNQRFEVDEKRVRLTSLWQPSRSLSVVGLLAGGRFDRSLFEEFGRDKIDGDRERSDPLQAEIATFVAAGKHSLRAGAGWFSLDRRSDFPDCAADPCDRISRHTEAWGASAYVHDVIDLGPKVSALLGIGVSRYSDARPTVAAAQPKQNSTTIEPALGVLYQPTPAVTLRAAASRSTRRTLVTSETLEPTQIFGFNRLFDDFDGAVSDQVGVGGSWRASERLRVGLAGTARDIDLPNLPDDPRHHASGTYEREYGLGGFIAYTPTDSSVISFSPDYRRYDHNKDADSSISGIDTIYLPLDMRYFFDEYAGVYLRLARIEQDVRVENVESQKQNSNSGNIVDLFFKVKILSGRGELSFGVANLLNDEFQFQDESFRSFNRDRHLYAFFPGRTFLFQARIPLGPWTP